MGFYRDLLPLLESLREHFGEIDEEVEEFIESSVRWVRQKYGAKKAQAHREFLKMVRKDPAAHRRKMRTDKLYHKKHKWHDRIMQRTARSKWRRVRRSRHEGLEERDVGQAFMDLPFELRVADEEASPDSMRVQTLIFDKEKFSRESAVKWAESHGFKASKVDEKENTFRLRQRDPDEFEVFRTITFKPGIKAVVAKP